MSEGKRRASRESEQNLEGMRKEGGPPPCKKSAAPRLFYACLFLSGKPLETDFLRKVAGGKEADFERFAEAFNALDLGVKIRGVAEGFQMVSDAELYEKLSPHFGEKSEALSKSALETVSVVAYKQPLTRAEVEEIRGVDCSGSMRTLLDRNLIRVSGRKNVPGRPLLYTTTDFFLEYFGLKSLSELPTFKEWSLLQGGNFAS